MQMQMASVAKLYLPFHMFCVTGDIASADSSAFYPDAVVTGDRLPSDTDGTGAI